MWTNSACERAQWVCVHINSSGQAALKNEIQTKNLAGEQSSVWESFSHNRKSRPLQQRELVSD